MPCRVHWLQLQQRRAELESLDVRVFIVTFDAPDAAREYIAANSLDWPLLLDPDRAVYARFGMGRGTWWSLLNPLTIWKYTVLWLKGTRPQKVGSDMRQLGGDVLIDPDGVVRLNHVSTGPHDRPSIESLIQIIRGDGISGEIS